MSITPEFRKSSYSQNSNQCVECAHLPEGAGAIRDTKHREAGHLSFPRTEWAAFLADLKGTVE